MRRLLIALSLLFAARAVHAQGMKIGYVDVQRAVQEVEEGKQARARLKSELDAKRASLDQKRATLDKMKSDYDKQVVTMSAETKPTNQQALQKAFTQAQNETGQMPEAL